MDLLASDRIGNKKRHRPKQPEAEVETAVPARWAQKLKVTSWCDALSEAGIDPEDKITEEDFKRALAAHNQKVMR
jgi:hypothetical protein